jgi:plasmid stability protein
MADILIRDVPDDVVAALDANARRAGLSRSEYLRRALAREGNESPGSVSVDDLAAFGERFSDLGDAEVMRQAWS